jgi:tight adherence protein B
MLLLGPVPYLYVRYRKHQRMKAFAQEFPDSLDLLVSALRAGLSFSAAMQIVAEESPEPVRGEFAITVEEQSLGLDFRECLVNLTRRVDSLDLRFFVTAVVLQRETGGNLAEILENTSRLIRDRFRILGDIQTFTAQGRLTGAILLCLPCSIGIFMFIMTPEYFKPMITSEAGRAALWFAGFMQFTGALIIRKIVNIKV